MAYEMVPVQFQEKEWWDVIDTPSEIKHQYFGFELEAEDICVPNLNTSIFEQNALLRKLDTGFSKVTNSDEMFKIELTCKPFAVGDLNVSTADGMVIVRFQHDSVPEGRGTASRKVERCYVLPKKCDVSNIKVFINGDVLTIMCKKSNVIPEKKLVVGLELDQSVHDDDGVEQ